MSQGKEKFQRGALENNQWLYNNVGVVNNYLRTRIKKSTLGQ